MTMGMVWVAFLAATDAGVFTATRTSTLRPTSSAILSPAGFQYDCLPFYVAQLSERSPKCLEDVLVDGGSVGKNAANSRDFWLRLRRGGERPPDRCAAEKCDELTPPHAIPRSTRMPEYQMSHMSTKAIAASQFAEARDVGCGSIRVEALESAIKLGRVKTVGHAERIE